ncbi:heterokaryon incompatibility protein-domain-containing protein [Cadophora sp. MPI-SDFR-AT-0126]|nr:heterokaryon incompatibility protein-domain-containing protein [Leotiomycetes sp. MPI-SDFR-AT-0126]
MPIRPGQDNDEKREYLYQPLRDDREIRLFKLAPAVSHDAQISVDFVPCSLDSADLPLFETISYVWGGPVDKAEISCEGKRLTIPKNLSDALLYPRNKYRPRILWTDYISINQSDAEEKGVQLGLMATTNRLAARSNIWIGPRLRSTKSAFGLLSKLQKSSIEEDSPRRTRLGLYQTSHHQDTQFCAAICMELSWVDACYGLEAYALYNNTNIIKSPGLKTILQLEVLRRCYREGQPLTLDMCLGVTRSLEATDMRDKIYAGYGTFRLANPEAPLQVDYSLSVHNTCDMVARTLNTGGSFGPFLASFSMIEDSGLHEPHEKLLSWMPDWSKPLNRYRLNQQECDFEASGSVTSEVPRSMERNPHSDVELFDGLIIDRVDKVSSFLPPRRFYDKFNASSANAFFFQEWYEWAEENASRIYNGDRDRLPLHWIETIQAKGCNVSRDPTWADSAQLLSQVRTWLRYLEDEDQEQTEQIRQLHAAALPSHGRRFGITARGHFCLVPRWAVPNDALCILYGAKVPFVLREREMKSKKVAENWTNIGECYVHDAMLGEALKWDGIQQMIFDIR